MTEKRKKQIKQNNGPLFVCKQGVDQSEGQAIYLLVVTSKAAHAADSPRWQKRFTQGQAISVLRGKFCVIARPTRRPALPSTGHDLAKHEATRRENKVKACARRRYSCCFRLLTALLAQWDPNFHDARLGREREKKKLRRRKKAARMHYWTRLSSTPNAI